MGYSIRIGEAKFYKNPEYNHIDIDVEEVKLESAPAFGEPISDYKNRRCPSYTAHHYFTTVSGIEDLFFNKRTGLMRDHPGVALLTYESLEKIRKYKAYRELNNDRAEPGFWDDGDDDHTNNGKDFVLAQLIWFEFWVEWALANCKNPVIVNS